MAKRSLSMIYRLGLAMRKSATTAEAKVVDSQISDTELESLTLPDCLLSFSSCGDLSNTRQGQIDDKSSFKKASEMPDFFLRKLSSSPREKPVSLGGMQTDHYKKKHSETMKKLTKDCAQKWDTEAMFGVLAKMGREMGVNEYNVVIRLCIQDARRSNDVESTLVHIRKAIRYLKEMKQLGLSIGKSTYGPLLKYLVDTGMVREFQVSKDVITETSPDALGIIGYYEMLLLIQVNDEEKIYELCSIIEDNRNSLSIQQEHYLVALCEKDRREDLQRLLKIIDITKVSSPHLLTNIFAYLGRSLLESIAIKFLWELRKCGKDGVAFSNLIFNYATCIPNSTVEDAILKSKKLHKELDIMPSFTSNEKLITSLCDLNEMAATAHALLRHCSMPMSKILEF